MYMIQKNWSDISTAPISEDAIRAMHVPPEAFRLYVKSHDAGTSFPAKAGHAFFLYVLSGSCKITLHQVDVELSAGEFAELDSGAYTVTVLGDQSLELIKVFGLAAH